MIIKLGDSHRIRLFDKHCFVIDVCINKELDNWKIRGYYGSLRRALDVAVDDPRCLYKKNKKEIKEWMNLIKSVTEEINGKETK